MKKVLIIEDRTQRQEEFLKKPAINIASYDFIDNKIGEKYTRLREKLLKDVSILKDYDIIISHRSAFDTDNGKAIGLIKDYCENNNKYLILFSGGISTSYYTKVPYEFLSLNSKDFYSNNLKLFLDNIIINDDINLLLLPFGERWELNLILNILTKLNTIDDEDIDDFNHLHDETSIKSIDRLIDLSNFNDNDKISLEDLNSIKKLIFQYTDKELGIYYE